MIFMILHLTMGIFLLFARDTGAGGKPEDFLVIKKDNGMELAERWIKSEGKTDRREVRIVMTVHTDPANFLRTLMDENMGKTWNVNSTDYRIKITGKDKWISYIQYDLPFPLSDRVCYFTNQSISYGDKTMVYFKSSHSDIFPHDSNYEKITGLEGKWILQREGRHYILSYHIISVPDKSLPRWMVDPVIRKNLWKSMENLRAILEKNTP
jgi:hypothetical protein